MSSSAKVAQHRAASSFRVSSRCHSRAGSHFYDANIEDKEEEYEDLPPSRVYEHHDIEDHLICSSTLGRHLARRLVEVGVTDVFSVTGDFNLILLDHLLAEPGLNLVGCCNELNAGYAADGYARSRGVGACAVTFTVGGLSVINAIAGPRVSLLQDGHMRSGL